MKDIVLILSDQHTGVKTPANTPFFDKLKDEASNFEYAYCSNPLCVPSRMSFLTGLSPTALSIYDNDCILDSDIPTLADELSQTGYETILVGRMHFKGFDQHHGFETRLVGDITTQFWPKSRSDLGILKGTQKVEGCQKYVGYGNSFVQEFDDAVLEATLKVLKENHTRPIFLVVGFYGPHFPYIVKETFFDHYYKQDLHIQDYEENCHPFYLRNTQASNNLMLQHIRSSYYGLIEKLDIMCHTIHTAYRQISDGVFIYTSDHGDMHGRRKLFGKKVFYEESIRVPLIIEDNNNHHFKQYTHPVSLLDLHRTILDYAQIKDSNNKEGFNCFNEINHPISITSYINDVITECIIFNNIKRMKLNDEIYVSNLNDEIIQDHAKDEIKQYWLSENEKNRILAELDKLHLKTEAVKHYTSQNEISDEMIFRFSNDSVLIPKMKEKEHELQNFMD